jgi:hypothetical protein
MTTAIEGSTTVTDGTAAQGTTEVAANAQPPETAATTTTETITTPSVPDTYEFSVGEGVTLDASVQELAVPLFKELGLPQESAQKVVNTYQKITALIDQRSAEAHQTMVAQWEADGRKDKDYGGSRYDKTLSEAQGLVARYGDDSLKQFLSDTGLGNHPGLLRLLANIGKHFSEAPIIPAGGNAGTGKVPLEDLLYSKK